MSILLEETGCLPSPNAKDVYVENSFANSTTQVGEDVFYVRTTLRPPPPTLIKHTPTQIVESVNVGLGSPRLICWLKVGVTMPFCLSVCLACVCEFIFHAALAASSSNTP